MLHDVQSICSCTCYHRSHFTGVFCVRYDDFFGAEKKLNRFWEECFPWDDDATINTSNWLFPCFQEIPSRETYCRLITLCVCVHVCQQGPSSRPTHGQWSICLTQLTLTNLLRRGLRKLSCPEVKWQRPVFAGLNSVKHEYLHASFYSNDIIAQTSWLVHSFCLGEFHSTGWKKINLCAC